MPGNFLDDGQEFDRSIDSPAFSNGFEGESWMSIWCEECRYEETCPLILVAILGRTPHSWEETDPLSLSRRYTCHEFEQSEEKQ